MRIRALGVTGGKTWLRILCGKYQSYHSVHSVHSVVKVPDFEPWNHRLHGVHRMRIRALGVIGGKTWVRL